ncbi:MAG: hypothetical protein P1U68_15135 [Verrucomicrobiales bacterium]|nr:hypothetical protein [Verrucomicrobiales bacterium]
MSLPVYYKTIIKAPGGRSISHVFCGEHHMGADHVEFIPSEPVHGVKRFFTTNGRVLFNDADSCFYLLEEHTLIVRIHSESWVASCLSQSRSEDFRKIRGELAELYPGGGIHETLVTLYPDEDDKAGETDRTSDGQALTEVVWEAGLGEAFEGVFPNADRQFVDRQQSLR